MEYISEPRVRLVTKTTIDWDQVAEFLDEEGVPPIPESIRAGDDESSAVVEISARLCYMSYGKGRRDITDFINNLLSKGDGSVFEHVNYGFVVTGVSRALTHELVRHRAGIRVQPEVAAFRRRGGGSVRAASSTRRGQRRHPKMRGRF